MARRIFLFLIFTSVLFATFEKVTCMLDFSQFHLPPCCYISPNGNPFSGYAAAPSKIESVSAKASSVNKGQATSRIEKIREMKLNAEMHNSTLRASVSSTGTLSIIRKNNLTSKSKPVSPTKIKIYRLLIPLEDIIQKRSETSEEEDTTAQPPETTQMKPPTTGRILFPEMKNRSIRYNNEVKFKRDSNQAIPKSKSRLLQEVISLELEDMESEKSLVAKKSLANPKYDYSTDDLQPEHRTFENEIDIDHEEQWEPKKLKSTENHRMTYKKPIDDNKDPVLASAHSIKRQVAKKMPASWLKNLRRALYQSITAGAKPENEEASDAPQDLSRERNSQNNPIVFPETWKTIQSAQLQFIDKMSQVASQLPNGIYLPPGEGPVVSGVLAITKDGGLQLRVASELYDPTLDSNNLQNGGCHCYLINQGEILMAYWSVSRVFNRNGQPALQYLVYPLPHSVPTPPELMPFSNDNMFQPSPIDPLTNFYEQSHNGNENQIDHPSLHHNIPPVRTPKFFHELPNGHHRLEVHENNRYQPISPTGEGAFGPETPLLNPQHPGVLIESNRQYTPEFIDLYRASIQHHFQQQDENDGRSNFHGTPYPYPEEFQNMGDYQQRQPSPPFPPVPPTPMINTNEQFVQERPLIMLPIQPVDPTTFPVQANQQISKPPTFPKSIQDIIAPFSNQNQVELGPYLEQLSLDQPVPPTQQQLQAEQPIPPTFQHNNIQQNNRNSPEHLVQQIVTINDINEPHNEDVKVDDQFPQNVQSTARPPNQNQHVVYKEKDNHNSKHFYDEGKRGGQQFDRFRDRPHTIANVLDNDKKYYPRRKPARIYVKDYLSQKDLYSRKQEINDTRGYILNF